ncbi:MAG: hypothetical protein R3C19_27085 [Planctomycetaceae bacterium]
MADAGIVFRPQPGDEGAVRMLLVGRLAGRATVQLRLLGRDRMELTHACGEPLCRFTRTVDLQPTWHRFHCRRLQRVADGLGGANLCGGFCDIAIPRDLLKRTAYLGLCIGLLSPLPDGGARSVCLWMERPKRDMGFGRHPDAHYGFLLTSEQVHRRVGELDAMYGLSRRWSEAGQVALRNLMWRIYGGYDLPLIDESLEDGQ